MLKDMLSRQLVDDILSFKFLINLMIILIAVLTFCFVFISGYKNDQEIYRSGIAENDAKLGQFAKDPQNNNNYANLQLVMKPKVESFISSGYEDEMPNGFHFQMVPFELKVINKKEEISGASGYEALSKREYVNRPMLFAIDLTFIVQFLFSFFAIVLGFNAATGEKEQGTLKLTFSNPVKRSDFLVVKYLSVLVTIGIPMLLGLMIGMIVVGISPNVVLSLSAFTRLFLFSAFSMLYLSLFVLLGLFCSVFSQDSKKSLVIGLLLWAFLVVILPKSGGLLLNMKHFDVPTSEQIETMAQSASLDVMKKYQKEFLSAGQDEEKAQTIMLKGMEEAFKAKQDIYDHYLQRKIAVVREIRQIYYFSPASLFEYGSSSIVGTGILRFQEFWLQARQFGVRFIDYVRGLSGEKAGTSAFYLDVGSISSKPIEFNSIPRFEEKEISIGDRITDILPFAGLLALFNLFLLVIVLYRFQTYDVR
jgi:ABC-type transport system involved in multi-copper enzyme maturation permease subunit